MLNNSRSLSIDRSKVQKNSQLALVQQSIPIVILDSFLVNRRRPLRIPLDKLNMKIFSFRSCGAQ